PARASWNELCSIGLVKLVEGLGRKRTGNAQFHATQRLERSLKELQVALDQGEPLRQRGHRVKGRVHDLVARMGDGTERKGANAFDEGEITGRVFDKHKSSSASRNTHSGQVTSGPSPTTGTHANLL